MQFILFTEITMKIFGLVQELWVFYDTTPSHLIGFQKRMLQKFLTIQPKDLMVSVPLSKIKRVIFCSIPNTVTRFMTTNRTTE